MTRPLEVVASDERLISAVESIHGLWTGLGAEGHLLARNLETGNELGFEIEAPVALASVVKVPIALAVLELIDRGALDPATPLVIDPATSSPGVTGVSILDHPARLALADLVAMAVTLSDNAAVDAVLEAVGLERVAAASARWGGESIRIRHPMRAMFDSATRAGSGSFELALELAISAPAGGGVIEALDPARANVGSARALVALLARVWRDEIATPRACAQLRRLMGLQVFTQRLAADLRSDAIRVSSKSGTFLNLRHDIGVIEAVGGERIAIAALTRTDRRATLAPDVDLAIGTAARIAFEALRG